MGWVWFQHAPVRIPGCEDTKTAQSRPQAVPLPALCPLLTLILAPTHLSQTQVGQEIGGGTTEVGLHALSKHLQTFTEHSSRG